jgi:hypothetical protein
MEFDAVVEAARGGGAVVALPGPAAAFFGTRARRPVVAWFNDVEYRGSTMPSGDGSFCVGVSKAVRAAAGVDVGDQVHVRIELDDTPRTIDVPGDLVAALARAGLTAPFESLSFTHRREYAEWVDGAKRPETRARRIEQTVARLSDAHRPSR